MKRVIFVFLVAIIGIIQAAAQETDSLQNKFTHAHIDSLSSRLNKLQHDYKHEVLYYAQEYAFYLQQDGTMLSANKDKYVVKEFLNTSKEELYNRTLIALSSLYINPQKVLSTVANEMISISAYADEIPFITVSTAMGKISGSPGCNYVLKLYFKDNKIRIDSPVILGIGTFNEVGLSLWLKRQRVYKNGVVNPKHQKTIDSVNSYFDNLINKILQPNDITNENW